MSYSHMYFRLASYVDGGGETRVCIYGWNNSVFCFFFSIFLFCSIFEFSNLLSLVIYTHVSSLECDGKSENQKLEVIISSRLYLVGAVLKHPGALGSEVICSKSY